MAGVPVIGAKLSVVSNSDIKCVDAAAHAKSPTERAELVGLLSECLARALFLHPLSLSLPFPFSHIAAPRRPPLARRYVGTLKEIDLDNQTVTLNDGEYFFGLSR